MGTGPDWAEANYDRAGPTSGGSSFPAFLLVVEQKHRAVKQNCSNLAVCCVPCAVVEPIVFGMAHTGNANFPWFQSS